MSASTWVEPDPKQGSVEMRNGATLFWETNAAGGRTYWSDEVGGGVQVWDTSLVCFGSLCEAISMEFALLAAEHRAQEKATREAGHGLDDTQHR